MKFRKTLKKGTLLLSRGEFEYYRSHDTNVTTVLAAETPLMVWGFRDIPEDHDHICGMEIEFLVHADIWAFPVPRNDHWSSYFSVQIEY